MFGIKNISTHSILIFSYTMPIERKLAAIMFTDLAGSTAQMSKVKL